ncbi:MAG: hypothetical protein HGA45_29920 [Chloroflexales bacterium]|nr:hypothetical protein [Chloroflexales bacterium]
MAHLLGRALGDPQAAAYDPRAVELLVDGQATRAGVLAALARLANRAGPERIALVSFSGHGAHGDDGLYYLATADTRFTPQAQVAAGTGVSVADLARAIRAVPARRLLLVVNACFAGHVGARLGAGGIAPDPLPAPAGAMLPDEAGNELVNSGEGRAIITASRPDQRSYFLSDDDHSLFGQALIDALRGASGGAVGLFELYEAVHTQVTGAARRRLGVAQDPALTLLQGVGPFPVAAGLGLTGREGAISQRPPAGAAVREVPPVTINVTNKRSVISFDNAQIMGDVSVGRVVEGDLYETNYGVAPAAPEADDPQRRLPLLRARIEVARNVDEDARDDAAGKLKQAERALGQGDSARARQRIEEALGFLRPMRNGYVNSVVRKLEDLAKSL